MSAFNRPKLLYPDIQALLIPAIRDGLEMFANAVPVSSSIPRPRPDSFVTVRRTGGNNASPVTESAQVTIDAWGQSEPAAAKLAQQVRYIVSALAGSTVTGVPVYRVDEYSAPAQMPDPDTGTPRYRQTFAVHVRGVEPSQK